MFNSLPFFIIRPSQAPFLLACCFLAFVVLLGSAPLKAQITDDFSDGNFTQNPVWQGDQANFIVNSDGLLQLNAPDAGASTLYVQGNIPDSCVWSLYFRLAFAPSTANLLRIYLLADQADLLNSNGYFLEIGENGTLDAFRFYRQDAGVKVLLATGTPGLVGTDPVALLIQMKKNTAGHWALEAGPPGGPFQAEFGIDDDTYAGNPNGYFGCYCLYSATRKDKFYFDQISILPDLPDTQAPKAVAASVVDATHVQVVFDEWLDSLSAIDPAHYAIAPGVGQPVSVELGGDKRTVTLTLATGLSTGTFTVQTQQVKDLAGNSSAQQTLSFQYVLIEAAEAYDLIINEIMADPSPTAGLPEVEWVEIYNRSAKNIQLSTLRLDDGGIPAALPDMVLGPDAYAVLCATSNAALFNSPGQTVAGLPSFPSLNNDADRLVLSRTDGTLVDAVSYRLDWHSSFQKKEGGWSLERINPNLPCLGGANWTSAVSLPGGTPGFINDTISLVADTQSPAPRYIYVIDNQTIRVVFSEGLDPFSLENTAYYHISPLITVGSVEPDPLDNTRIVLHLAQSLQGGVFYSLHVDPGVTDCSGNGVATATDLTFGLPEKPAPGDIVVNEILSNPLPGNARYVEFVNKSNKFFNANEFFIGNFYKQADVAPVVLQVLIIPGQYFVTSTDPDNVRGQYQNIHPENIVLQNGPYFADDAGNITLYWVKNGETVVLDSVTYASSWHNALFTSSEREGVALERVRVDGPSNSASNWASASDVVCGAPGTPTLPNSQRLEDIAVPDDSWLLLPVARLSPDGDGFEDFLDIQYRIPATGYAAAITVFDSEGIPVKHLLKQTLLGTQGSIRWDGDADDGSRARPGLYILYAELFHPDGSVRRIKKTVALVRKTD